MVKLNPKRDQFTAHVGSFRVTPEDKQFLESYAHETETGMVDVIRLAIENLKEAVAREKKKLAKEAVNAD